MISRARNSYEHPGQDPLVIKNFEFQDGKLLAPLWHFPSDKPTAVFKDMPVILSGLVQFAEGNFVHAYLDNVGMGLPC